MHQTALEVNISTNLTFSHERISLFQCHGFSRILPPRPPLKISHSVWKHYDCIHEDRKKNLGPGNPQSPSFFVPRPHREAKKVMGTRMQETHSDSACSSQGVLIPCVRGPGNNDVSN